MRIHSRLIVASLMSAALALGTELLLPAISQASFLLDRNATHVKVQADARGNALVSYKVGRASKKVLVWGGQNATLKFRIDRSAGWKSHRINYKKPFPNSCRAVSAATINSLAPATPTGQQVVAWNVVAACRAADGSYWVAQSWPRMQRDFGGLGGNAPKELRVSHVKGQLASLWIKGDWSWSGQWQHLYGQLSYGGAGWWGKGGLYGASIDGKARNVAFDALDSDYPGTAGRWARVNAILTNNPNGQFCFGFAPKFHSASDPGLTAHFKQTFPLWRNAINHTGASRANQYRAIVPGPGVTPDIAVSFSLNDPATYWLSDGSSQSGFRYSRAGAAIDAAANNEQAALAAGVGGGSCSNPN